MQEFILREIHNTNMTVELEKIGFDKSYIHKAVEKFDFHNIKIYDLTVPQVNILKQTALSVGADCATHRETITAKVEKSDCILGGSVSQLEKIACKLEHQPFSLKILGGQIREFLSTLAYKKSRTKIVGILNLTENSFSDGGMYWDSADACAHLREMINEGADIIDIGAESTKPYSHPIAAENQLEKLLPVLEFVRNEKITTPISVDTRSAFVAQECIKAGVQIVNDVSGLEYDLKMADVVASTGVKIIIQHSKGTPEIMQVSPYYESLMDEIFLGLKKRVDVAISKGILKENIILDPGIGFGKTREDNFEILHRISELYSLGCPVMLGLSRKSLLNMPEADNLDKDIYTVALNTLAIKNKIDYIRVHNVKLHRHLLDFSIA